MRAPNPLALGTRIAFWSAPSDRADRPAETALRQSFDRMRLSDRQHTLEPKALFAGIGEGMKLGAGEAGREARPDKKNLHSRELIRAIETPRIASP